MYSEELFYEMIYKRKSFHLFRDTLMLTDAELKEIEDVYGSLVPLVSDIRTAIRIVTVVLEDGEIVSRISQMIHDTGNGADVSQIDGYWWNRFKELFENAHGENFRTQRELETASLRDTIVQFGSDADAVTLSNEMFAYWQKPGIFEESKEFFAKCPVPVYIISNIDNVDIQKAIEYHGLKPRGIFTSEDARSYKPRKELFELVLRETGLQADEVIHIGDSLSSDVKGATAMGIKALWLNRSGKSVPEGVTSVRSLLDNKISELLRKV